MDPEVDPLRASSVQRREVGIVTTDGKVVLRPGLGPGIEDRVERLTGSAKTFGKREFVNSGGDQNPALGYQSLEVALRVPAPGF
jgi:hypothetical protein